MHRQIQHNTQRTKKSNELLVRSTSYKKSPHLGYLKLADQEAKKLLSQHAYTVHCIVQKQSKYMESEVKDGIVYCYPAGSEGYMAQSVSWPLNKGCPCWRSHNLDFQCEHELKHDRLFIANKFGDRWLQDYQYAKINPSYGNLVHTSSKIKDPVLGFTGIEVDGEGEGGDTLNAGGETVNDDFDFGGIDNAADDVDFGGNNNAADEDHVERNYLEDGSIDIGLIDNKDEDISNRTLFAMAQSHFLTLWRLIEGDRKLQHSFIVMLNKSMDRAREGKDINIQSWIEKVHQPADAIAVNALDPVPGMKRVPSNGRSIGRYKSGREGRRKRTRKAPPMATPTVSVPALPVIGTTGRTKTCSFCRDAGHQIGTKCPRINTWGGTLLVRDKDGQTQRQEFNKHLRNVNSDYAIAPLLVDRHPGPILTEIGKGTKGLVLHQRFFSGITNLNVIIECTLLKNMGIPCEVNAKVLIQVEAVEHYICRSKTNMVIIQLVQLAPTQLSQVSHSFSQQANTFSFPGTIDYTTGYV